jgi:hypothetical protein
LIPCSRCKIKQPGLSQLEAPSEVVNLDGGPIFAKEVDETGWVASGNSDSIPLLVRYLKSQDKMAQRGALAEFAGMGAKAKKAVPAIVEALQDENSSIRSGSCRDVDPHECSSQGGG